MYHAGNISFMFRFDRDTITIVTHCDHSVLKIGAVRAIDHVCKLAVYFFIGEMDAAPDMLECRARVIRDFLLRNNTAVNLILERSERFQMRKIDL